MILMNGLSHHLALGFDQLPRSILQLGHRLFIQRKSDLYHTDAILPYSDSH